MKEFSKIDKGATFPTEIKTYKGECSRCPRIGDIVVMELTVKNEVSEFEVCSECYADFLTGKDSMPGIQIKIVDKAPKVKGKRKIKNLILDDVIGKYNKYEKQYHSELSPELEYWYCYPVDAGHSILCILEEHFKENMDYKNYLVPCPVKSVLYGYRKVEDYIIVDIPYSKDFGLNAPEGDTEF